MKNLYIPLFSLCLMVIAGCASERKARQLEREKVSQATGLFCDFVNGDQYHDVDVQMNFNMSKKCDPSKPFSITGYRNSSEMYGVLYCCNVLSKGAPVSTPAVAPAPVSSAAPAPANSSSEKKNMGNNTDNTPSL